PDRSDSIAERAADVDVNVGFIHNHAGIVAAPRPGKFGDVSRRRGGARQKGGDRKRCDDLRGKDAQRKGSRSAWGSSHVTHPPAQVSSSLRFNLSYRYTR